MILRCLLFLTFTIFAGAQRSASNNPCATLSQSLANQSADQSANSASPSFKPSQVYACLKDVPINITAAADLIDYLEVNLQFQSTLAYLKSPPSSYPRPAVDLLGGLSSIKENVQAGRYDGEYGFEYDIWSLIAKAFDGHLSVLPFLIGSFAYGPRVVLASVSMDGTEAPKVYFKSDLSEQVKSPSPIVRIDDVDIDDWLMTLPNYFQDPDAQYNGALFNPGNFVLGGVSNGQASYQNEFVFHNDSTKYSFANGTSRTVPNKAFSQIPIDARSGLELFERYLIPSNSAQTQSSPSGNPGPPSASATSGAFENYTDVGFPVPLVGTSDGALSGYFLDSAPNTAVLSIQTFEPSVSPVDVSNAVKSFLAKARAGNKSRLVIDIRGNPGGNVFLGFDVFKQLFPGVTPYSATRFRAHPGSEAIGLVASQDGPPQSTFVDVRDKNLQISQFNYHDFLKSPDGASFASFDEYFGPFEANGDNFSSTASWEFSNQALDILSDNIVVSGYANETELPPQPFPASNIVVITDGQCQSTCATFTNLLLGQKVSTVAIGGRPQNHTMAVIGGVQGATIYKIPQVQAAASLALEALDQNIFTVNNQVSVGNALNSLSQLPPLNMFSPMSVNLRDNIPANDKSMTPLQFASPITAECRIWYMPQDILNVTNTWERIANKQYRCADSGRNPVQAQPVTTSAAMSRRGNGVGKLVLAVTFCSFALVGYIW